MIYKYFFVFVSEYTFEEGAFWSATPGDSAGHLASQSIQKHINKDFQYTPAFDHYSFISAPDQNPETAPDRVLGVSWIGTACLRFPEGMYYAKLIQLLIEFYY